MTTSAAGGGPWFFNWKEAATSVMSTSFNCHMCPLSFIPVEPSRTDQSQLGLVNLRAFGKIAAVVYLHCIEGTNQVLPVFMCN